MMTKIKDMENLHEFEVIFVKNKDEVLKAAELLEKIGISVFKSSESLSF